MIWRSLSVCIGTQPQVSIREGRIFAPAGRDVTFHVTLDGTEPVRASWSRQDGAPLPNRAVTDPRSHDLTIHDVITRDTGIYVVMVTSQFGTDTAEAELNVQGIFTPS